ncbi:MAG TPA: DoxX family membrane protein [Candidatus Saccharimonadales bacterium]|nr:DoxX family membrane protein [Candidatus Saccharimonadales bacterium]
MGKSKTASFSKPKLAAMLLRIGLAVIFLYAAISSFVNPNDWVGYLPSLLTDHVSATVALKFFSAYELLLVVWLLSGVYVRYVALLCVLTLGGIVTANFHLFVITFRDIALMFAAAALAVLGDE